MRNAAEKNEKYILVTGDDAVERLELQNRLFAKETKAHLQKAKLSKGMIIWEVGCGVGAMTSYLANEVGETGHVYALDISKEQLESAEKRIRSEGIKNVTFINGDINTLESTTTDLADLVYMRFVLMHLEYPENAIEKIKKLLKKGGVNVSQESNTSTILNQGIDVIDHYTKTAMSLAKHNNIDYDIGNRMEALYKQAGFNPVNVYYNQQKIQAADFQKMLLMSFCEWKNKAIELKIATEKQVEIWEKEIEAIPTNDQHLMFDIFKQAHVLAWK
ncbi:MAG: class I SAM-dependent methyltransferase [Alphaproteobacteria bacterium]|nr:class I SAM-dependent methyltransferase [Alphaproteobacteria bacterium]